MCIKHYKVRLVRQSVTVNTKWDVKMSCITLLPVALCNSVASYNPNLLYFVIQTVKFFVAKIVICNPALSIFVIFKPMTLGNPSLSYFVILIFYRCVYQKSSWNWEIFFWKLLFINTWQLGKHSLNSLNRFTLVYIAIGNFQSHAQNT